MDHIYPTKDYTVYKIKDEVDKLKASLSASKMPADFKDVAKLIGITFEKLKEVLLNNYY